VLLVAFLVTGNHSNATQSAGSTTTDGTGVTSDSSTISPITSSVEIAKGPLLASASPSASKTGNAAKKSVRAGATSGASSSPASGGTGSNSLGSSSGGGPITTGDSKVNCITLNFPSGIQNESVISAATSLTGVTYNCIDMFANPLATWSDWEAPWMFQDPAEGWDAWLAASSDHQVVVGMDLIPQSVSNGSDPLSWEQACASGSYNQYATALAKNLVSYGAANVAIRLGVEANGTWEIDYVGSTTTEMSDWAKCFDNEVTAMRAVPGANFLFVWNPNLCVSALPINEWYPGNSYVDIIGLDAYDQDCATSSTVSQEGWAAFSADPQANPSNDPNFPSLVNFESFAVSNNKPLAFAEWGIDSGTADDPAYVTDMIKMFNQDRFAFQSYYDTGGGGIVPLGSEIPSATAAYAAAFK
jgi:hypothetical protein